MAADNNQPVLSDRYYLDNFKCLVDFVFEHYKPLLSSEEQHFYHQFTALQEHCQRLYIRLLSRSGEYVRVSRINYPEIDKPQRALETLKEQNLLSKAQTEHLPEWLSLFTKKELGNSLGVSVPEPDITAALLTTSDLFGGNPLELLLQEDQVILVHHQYSFITFRLLFFGNLHQDLSTFVLRDLGLRKFESYLTDTSTLPFKSREQIEAYLQYYGCTEQYDEAEHTGPDALVELNTRLPASCRGDPALRRRIDRFSNKIARQLERFDHLVQAADIYRNNMRPPARERIARIEAKLGNLATAFELCQQIQDQPIDAEEKEFAQQFAARIAGKIGAECRPPEKHTPDEITLQLSASTLSVEFAAALHFAKYGKCYYVENSLIVGIFGLAIWDILFAPISGAFYHPFQSAPADFHEPDFYLQRSTLFKQRFDEIRHGDLAKIVLTHFHTKRGIRNPLVNWSHLDRYLTTLALKKIPTDHWLMLFDYLLQDIRNHRSGLPDLIHFPDDGGYVLLEVKGPGDRLQKNQLRWMRHFNECKIRHAAVLVEYQNADSKSIDDQDKLQVNSLQTHE